MSTAPEEIPHSKDSKQITGDTSTYSALVIKHVCVRAT